MTQSNNISIAMCTDNGKQYLWEQLQEVASVTRLSNEIVICDDRPTQNERCYQCYFNGWKSMIKNLTA
jgi:hypothetical protein